MLRVCGIAVTLAIGAACINELALRPAGSATLALLLMAAWVTGAIAWVDLRRRDAAGIAERDGTAYLLRRAHVRSGFFAIGWAAIYAVMGWVQFTLLGRSYGDVGAGFVAGIEVGICVLVPTALFTVGATHSAVRRLKARASPAHPESSREDSAGGNMLLRHWRGEYNLPRAFWLHGVGLNVAYDVLSAALGLIAERIDVRLSAIVCLVLLILYPPILIWQWVGIWRSSMRYRAFYGTGVAPVAACAFVALSAVLALRFYVVSAPIQLRALDEILRGDPQWDRFSTRLTLDGKGLLIQGNLQAGCHDVFRRALEDAPGVRTILIDSPGGRLAEGERMAIWIRERHLDTRAVGQCASAATVVFLAGRHRSIGPLAVMGFHAPTAPEASLLLQLAMRFQLDEDMRAAGVSEPFVRHTLRTPPDSIWNPAPGELVAAGVVTN
ncbi:MAG TPA: hypothetical protein VGL42_00925 [Opitutaceae bacterium]